MNILERQGTPLPCYLCGYQLASRNCAGCSNDKPSDLKMVIFHPKYDHFLKYMTKNMT